VALLKDPAGVMIGMVAVNRDLTHIKLAARVAEISEQKFRTIFEQTPDVVAVVNSSEWVVQSINAAVEQQLGYAPETLIGKPFSTLFPPDAGSPDLLLERTTTYGAVFADQPFMRRDGTLCDMDLTATMIPWDDNQAVLVTLRDVSERKRLERELLKAELERVSLEKDREVLELKEAFIATVSHDFRSPLASISMATEMLTEYRDRLTPERTLDHLGSIRQQASYMLRLLDDVLYFNKTKAGKLDFEPSTIDLVSYGQVLFEQLRQEASPAHSFVYNAAGELREAYMDEKILQRVLSNLIGNAIKYSPEGGEIRFQITREDDDVLFEISDQGIGIPPEDQAKIFEPFSRARNARKIKGTGLGMAIVYDNIKLHGGDVWLRSAEGQGTTFTVRLPYRVNAPKV
jgi:PAS domain S-box-containing protein